MNITGTILGKIPRVGKPQQKFLSELFNIMFCVIGRYNFTNLSRFSQYRERSLRRWFSRSFDFERFNLQLLSLLPFGKMIACIDASAFAKSGRKTHGKGRFWSGSLGQTIAGIEISCIALVHLKFKTAFNLSVRQTDGKLKGEETRIDQYIQQFLSVLPILKLFTRFMVADSFYSKNKFVNAMANNKFSLISKLRHDANLQWLYKGQHLKRKGRKKKFDGKVSFSSLDRFRLVTTLEDTVIYEAIVYSVSLKRNIKLVLLKNMDNNGYALLFSTDTRLPAITIIKYYRSRFQIEFLFRDAKQHTGLTHCQSTKKEAIHFHCNAALTAVNIAKYDILQANSFNPNTVFSLDNYKRLKYNEHCTLRIISMLDLDLNTIKLNPIFDELFRYGVFEHIRYSKAA